QPPHQVLPNYPHAHAILIDAQNRYGLAPTLGNDCVSQFRFDANTGMLAPNTPPAVRLHAKSGPRHLGFHPNRRVGDVLGGRDGPMTVCDYEAETGQLTAKQLASAPPPHFQGHPAAADLHITPDGRFLYGSERTSSTLTGFTVNPTDGTLATMGSVPTEQQPRGFNIDPSGCYVLAGGQMFHVTSLYAICMYKGQPPKRHGHSVGNK